MSGRIKRMISMLMISVMVCGCVGVAYAETASVQILSGETRVAMRTLNDTTTIRLGVQNSPTDPTEKAGATAPVWSKGSAYGELTVSVPCSYLEFDIDVTTGGIYGIDLRAQTASANSKAAIFIDGEKMAHETLQDFYLQTAMGLYFFGSKGLTPGKHQVRICIYASAAGKVSFDYIRFCRNSVASGSDVPLADTAHNLANPANAYGRYLNANKGYYYQYALFKQEGGYFEVPVTVPRNGTYDIYFYGMRLSASYAVPRLDISIDGGTAETKDYSGLPTTFEDKVLLKNNVSLTEGTHTVRFTCGESLESGTQKGIGVGRFRLEMKDMPELLAEQPVFQADVNANAASQTFDGKTLVWTFSGALGNVASGYVTTGAKTVSHADALAEGDSIYRHDGNAVLFIGASPVVEQGSDTGYAQTTLSVTNGGWYNVYVDYYMPSATPQATLAHLTRGMFRIAMNGKRMAQSRYVYNSDYAKPGVTYTVDGGSVRLHKGENTLQLLNCSSNTYAAIKEIRIVPDLKQREYFNAVDFGATVSDKMNNAAPVADNGTDYRRYVQYKPKSQTIPAEELELHTVTYEIQTEKAGVYDIQMTYFENSLQGGIWALYVNDVRVGAFDFCTERTKQFKMMDCGSATFNKGANTIKWVLAGAGASSTHTNGNQYLLRPLNMILTPKHVSSIVTSIPADGRISASATVRNYTGSVGNVALILACYKGAELLGVHISQMDIPVALSNEATTLQISDYNITDPDTDTVSIYLWDMNMGVRPLAASNQIKN